jgi:hypothetical protein
LTLYVHLMEVGINLSHFVSIFAELVIAAPKTIGGLCGFIAYRIYMQTLVVTDTLMANN